MNDLEKLAKARRELEELYLGVPDDSVNLTFQNFGQLSHSVTPPSSTAAGKHKLITSSPVKITSPHLTKIPSLDFSRGLEASSTAPPPHHYHHHHRHLAAGSPVVALSPGSSYGHGHHRHVIENSMTYDDVSMMSGMSMTSMYQEKTLRRRTGIPHSNICTVCSVYIYMFRNRCLVCGRVYCRQCLNIGMGEMTEGRKCIDCLGRKFSQRYIHRAGDIWCWSSCFNGYPNSVKIQELKWAEKGPRRSGENMYKRSVMMSKSRSPLGGPITPNRSHFVASGPPSFVTTPEYSPYATPTRHHLPF